MTDGTPELNAALAAAQGEFPAITKSKEVTVKTKTGGNYSYSYAPLDAIFHVCRPILARNGLALTQLLEDGAIRTELRHASGGVIGSSFPLPAQPSNAQELGSLLTYLRRYAIVAMLGIAAEDDDDGAQATEAKPAGRKRAAAPRSQPSPSPGPLEPSQEHKDAFYKPEPITDQQRRRLYALFTEKQIMERGKQLSFCTQALGRTIESSKEMGKAEATAVIRQLEEWDPENPQTFPRPPTY